jgi:hypothetical protein
VKATKITIKNQSKNCYHHNSKKKKKTLVI